MFHLLIKTIKKIPNNVETIKKKKNSNKITKKKNFQLSLKVMEVKRNKRSQSDSINTNLNSESSTRYVKSEKINFKEENNFDNYFRKGQ